jgi:NAD(P)H-dependent flavin oxidoreductase YrpB (nitropropane dioxygenase family)
MHARLHTRFCDLVGVEYPIVQTGMGWVSGAGLTAATAAAGGLGLLASATMDFDQLRRAITQVRQRTSNPFGVNLRADAADIDDRIQLLIDEQVKVASFAQAPREALIGRLQDGGVLVVPSIGAKRHAEKVLEWGVDAVLVQGGEGGGHTGAVATTSLLPQVVDAVDLPVIAAGGFFDGRGLVAALAYGAAGVAMGTRFLLTQESTVPDSVKQYYLSRTVADTVVTSKIDGVPHRVLRTEFVDELERTSAVMSLPRALRNALEFKKMSGVSWRGMLDEGRAMKREGDLRWSQVVLAANTPMLLRAGLVEGRLDAGVLSSGQVAGVIDDLPSVAELVARIMQEAQDTLKRLRELE